MIHLQNAINGLIAKIRNKFPSAITKMSEKVFGDEDADLYVHVPLHEVENVRSFLREETLDMFLEQDVDIVPLVYEKSESDTASRPDPILFSHREEVATITLNRPEKFNAIDLMMCEELRARLTEAAQDPCVRAVILTGNGKAFCAGGDLRFALAANPETPGDSFLALTAILHSCIAEIRNMAKPVIAAINGPAAGAGFFLALACDLRIIADSAYLKQSNTSHGLSIPAGGSFTLPRLVGMARALEIVMLDENMPAERAFKLGLVNKVTPEAALLEEAHRLAERVAKMPVGILGQVKRLMNNSFWATLDEQLESERNEIAMSANSMEGREGISAFVEKRQPDFVAAGECHACEDGSLAVLFSADESFPPAREALNYA